MRTLCLISIVLMASGAALQAQDPAPPATADKPAAPAANAPAEAGKPIRVTVESVSGSAQKMDPSAEDKSWKPIQAGDVLTELTVIRTGLRSSVVLVLEDRGRVTINSGTKIGIAEASRQGTLAKTRLGLKYGTLRAKVDSSTGPSDFQVATPVATLSVRGSLDDFGFGGDSGAQGQSFEGTLNLQSGGGSQTVGPGQQTNNNLGLPLDNTLLGFNAPMGQQGQNPDELNNLNNNGDGRGIFGFGGNGNTGQNFTGPYTTSGYFNGYYDGYEPYVPSTGPQ